MTIDEWCFLQVDGEKRVRGRLLTRGENELVLVTGVGSALRLELEAVDPKQRQATLTDGRNVRWTRTCGCGQPAALKGPAARLLEAVAP